MPKRTLFERIMGYCPMCGLWFRRGVRDRPISAEYIDEGVAFITACEPCHREFVSCWDQIPVAGEMPEFTLDDLIVDTTTR